MTGEVRAALRVQPAWTGLATMLCGCELVTGVPARLRASHRLPTMLPTTSATPTDRPGSPSDLNVPHYVPHSAGLSKNGVRSAPFCGVDPIMCINPII